MDQLTETAQALADAVEAALPRWVEDAVVRRAGRALPTAQAAGVQATADVVPRLRALLATDIDSQRTNPLAILREATRYPTEVLRAAGVAPVERDDFQRDRFPDDAYDLVPVSFADLGPEVAEAGIAWGAAKAWTHRQRHSS
ncbi:MAG: hypothetical protein QOE35_372 [Actinomycetota bacterium]|jgi:hypothetical protein